MPLLVAAMACGADESKYERLNRGDRVLARVGRPRGMSRDWGACGLGRRREERLRLGGARGLSAHDERGDHEHRPDEEERRERAGAAGVRRGDVVRHRRGYAPLREHMKTTTQA